MYWLFYCKTHVPNHCVKTFILRWSSIWLSIIPLTFHFRNRHLYLFHAYPMWAVKQRGGTCQSSMEIFTLHKWDIDQTIPPWRDFSWSLFHTLKKMKHFYIHTYKPQRSTSHVWGVVIKSDFGLFSILLDLDICSLSSILMNHNYWKLLWVFYG